jgi:endopeptidase Clp ATP-binding regulatory subunit ClpX
MLIEGAVMPDDANKTPDQEDLEKELSDYLSKKYGARIKVISPMMMSQPKETVDAPEKKKGVEQIKFDLKPEELEEHLNQYVIKQDEAKAVLATKICTHYNRIKLQRRKGRGNTERMVGRIKSNIILAGPTGVGKTFLIKLIAQKLGVPFVKGDATKFSETGYVGGDVEDLVRDLVIEADDDIELAEHGIIYIDEIDKIASSRNLIGPDVSRTGVQRALLKPMEDTDVDLKVAHDPVSQIQAIEHYRKTGKKEKRTVNTANILFIVSGAFNELAGIVKNRLQKQGIGFGADLQSKGNDYKFLEQAKAEDLIAYGFESEFVGRLPVIAVLEPLEVKDLYHILQNPNNPIILGKKEDFRAYGIDIRFEDEALHMLAERAALEKTGARGLVSVIERALLPFEKKLPSYKVHFFVVSRAVVENPKKELERILANPDDEELLKAYNDMLDNERDRLRDEMQRSRKRYLENYPLVFNPERIDMVVEHRIKTDASADAAFDEVVLLYNQVRVFEADYYEKQGFRIQFDEDAINGIIQRALDADLTAAVVCQRISKDYDYGFKLISERTGQTQFVLPRRAVDEPDLFLDELIRETYHQHPLGPPELKREL